ncbi:hypothetical protein [Tellurirhabdus bombi]|uniref:hypothetical protein n=1 Tax=Tellurirhabdus bombi TaxID=2907205 RepID=UPI001F44D239|nr:hypothetical protein [Tellurirhabdus bombi]
MKTILVNLLALTLLSASCEKNPTGDQVTLSSECPSYNEWQKAADLTQVPGTVINESDTSKSSTWMYIQAGDNKRYFACNLPASVQKTGTRVIFDAVEFMPPPNVRLAGIPIKLTRLQVLK